MRCFCVSPMARSLLQTVKDTEREYDGAFIAFKDYEGLELELNP